VYVDALIARDRNTDGNTTTGTGGLEERVYALQDANWNTTALVAATGISGLTLGNVFTRFVYTPYGESQNLTASWVTPAAGSAPITPWSHFFQGLKVTDVTGLAYVRHRDYSPTLGRFIERDPIGFEARDNNWYRFVANGPTGKTDPSGLAVETGWDLFNVGTGFISLFGNIVSGNVAGAAVDLAGLTYDLVATAVPGLPGGASQAVQATRVARVARIALRPAGRGLSSAIRTATNAAQNGKDLVRYAVTTLDDAHHIIPKSGPNAGSTALRAALDCIRENARKAGIDLESAMNGVSLPTSYHRQRVSVGGEVNTLQKWYYERVRSRFEGVTDRATFQRELDAMAEYLLQQSGKMK